MMMIRANMMLTTSLKVPLRIRDRPMKIMRIRIPCCNFEDKIATTNSKFDKFTQQVASLEWKLDLVLKSLFEIKDGASSKLHCETQLDQLISLCLSSTLEDVQSRYKDNIDHHVTTINTMLKVHDDILPHIRHEKHIQRLEKEIR